jgi:hypothetical protein
MTDNGCTANPLATILGALRGVALPELPACVAPPAHRVLVRLDVVGVCAELSAEVCDEHDLLLSATAEYVKSIGLSRTTPGR